MITQLAHVCIGAKDLDEAKRFYCDGLGMTKKFDFIKDGELFGFYLEVGRNTFVEVFQMDSDIAAGKSLVQHFCLEVDDIDAMGQHMKPQGWEVTDKKKEPIRPGRSGSPIPAASGLSYTNTLTRAANTPERLAW